MSGLPQFGLPRFFAIIPSDARKCYLDAKLFLKSACFLYFTSGGLGKLQIEAAQVLAKRNGVNGLRLRALARTDHTVVESGVCATE
jgi:hypothetical protein